MGLGGLEKGMLSRKLTDFSAAKQKIICSKPSSKKPGDTCGKCQKWRKNHSAKRGRRKISQEVVNSTRSLEQKTNTLTRTSTRSMFIPKPKFLIRIRHFVAAFKGESVGGHPGFKVGAFYLLMVRYVRCAACRYLPCSV